MPISIPALNFLSILMLLLSSAAQSRYVHVLIFILVAKDLGGCEDKIEIIKTGCNIWSSTGLQRLTTF